jgi:multidrug resistance efflux pump
VTEILVYETLKVRAGDILLRVNDEPFQQMLVKAELGVRAAELDLAQARQGLEQHRHAVEAQKAKVEIARHLVDAGEAKLRHLRFLKDEFGRSNDDEIKEADENLKAGRKGVEAEGANLRRLEASRPDAVVEKAILGVETAKKSVEQARTALDHCVLKAPTDGTILRLGVAKGSLISGQMRQPPVLFLPAGPRIVRAEVPPEFAHRVHEGMPAVIHDEANAGASWQGTVKRLADAYLPKRGAGAETITLGGSDTLTLECVVELDPTQSPPRPGQRVRVGIGTQRAP